MTILLGIPTHKRPDLLRQTLRSIEMQQGQLPRVEIFVADNDPVSQEGSAVVADLAGTFRFPLSSTAVKDPGISAVRNAILAEARARDADMVAMIDDDVRASPSWLRKLIDAAGEHGAEIVAGPVLYEFERTPAPGVARAFAIAAQASGPIDLISGTTGVLITRAVLDRANWPLFDPAYGLTGGGDKEWFTRMKKCGARFAWAADALMYEFVPASRSTRSWLLKRNFRYGIDQVRIARAHGTSNEVAILVAKSGTVIFLSPFLALGLVSAAHRTRILCHWARAVGRLGGLAGVRVHEYAVRHVDRP